MSERLHEPLHQLTIDELMERYPQVVKEIEGRALISAANESREADISSVYDYTSWLRLRAASIVGNEAKNVRYVGAHDRFTKVNIGASA